MSALESNVGLGAMVIVSLVPPGRMLLGIGTYLASIAEMTRKQTAEGVPNEYGLGWGTAEGKEGVYGHGGACKTYMRIKPKLGLITVFILQYNGDWPNEEAGTIDAVFTAAAEKLLG